MNYFLISFILGIFLAEFLNYNELVLKILLGMASALFLIILIYRKDQKVKLLGLSALGLVLALFYFQFFVPKNTPDYVAYYNGQNLTVIGTIIDEPQKSEKSSKLIVKINDIKGKVLVNTTLFPEYHFADKIKFEGKLEEPPIFEEFNYQNYLKANGVYSIANRPKIEKIGEEKSLNWKKYLFHLKTRFSETITKVLPEPEAALANGLVLGTRQTMPDWLLQAFILVGLTHIIALSGYNITIISKNLSVVFNWFIPRFSFYFSLFSIWLFVIMVGAAPSIVRAALMGSMYLIAQKINRKRDIFRALLLTAWAMILFNPYILRYDTGFQLSFLATSALIYLSPLFEKLFKKIKITGAINEAASATLSAQIFVLPILFVSFKKISLIAPIANILVLPIIPFSMFFVFLTGIFGMFSLPLGHFFGWFSFVFLKYIILVSEYFSKIPFAALEIKKTSIIFIIVYWLILGILVRYFEKHGRERL